MAQAKKKKSDKTYVYVFISTTKTGTTVTVLSHDEDKAIAFFKKQAKRAKIRVFAGDLFFEVGLQNLKVGQTVACADLQGREMVMRLCEVE